MAIGPTHGEVGGPRHYEGAGLPTGPWKCPACTAENVGDIAEGCAACGSGSAKPYKVERKVATPPPADLHIEARPVPNWLQQADIAAALERSPEYARLKADMKAGAEAYSIAGAWAAAHPDASLAEAFIAGMQFTHQRTLAAPPVTADIPELSPEGKVARTIIAALELFKDQVLREAKEEIASGEFCSIEEVDQVIAQLREKETT